MPLILKSLFYTLAVNVCILAYSFIYWMRMMVLNSSFNVTFIFLDPERGPNWFLLQTPQILAWHLQLGKRYKDMDWCGYGIIQSKKIFLGQFLFYWNSYFVKINIWFWSVRWKVVEIVTLLSFKLSKRTISLLYFLYLLGWDLLKGSSHVWPLSPCFI